MTRAFWRAALRRRVVVNSLRVAAVVGALLNLVNQGPALWAGTGVSWTQVLLNFAVPYCVATYGAAQNEIARDLED